MYDTMCMRIFLFYFYSYLYLCELDMQAVVDEWASSLFRVKSDPFMLFVDLLACYV